MNNSWNTREIDILCFLKAYKGFPGGSVVKNLPANAGDRGSMPGSGRSPREGNGNPLWYSCLGNPTDRGARWSRTLQKSWTQPGD